MKIIPKLDAGPFMLKKLKLKHKIILLHSQKVVSFGIETYSQIFRSLQSHSFKFEEQDKSKITYAKK